jgi:membrane-associated phospholipid phosphatase
MPSGDTVQSMFFSMVMVMWYGVDPGIMLIFHVLVAVSRVYFMCHWLGDTIAASIITYPIGLLFLWIHSTGLRSYQPTLNNLL